MDNINIIFNGRNKIVEARSYSYADLIYMSFEDRAVKPMSYPDVMTITYDRGPANNSEGSLTQGDHIQLVEGMIVNAMRTDNS